jgi:phage FluMu protein Com
LRVLVRYARSVGDVEQPTLFEVKCPHCHKLFTGELLGGGAARYRGFKCPHCKLFVPAAHGEDGVEPDSRES